MQWVSEALPSDCSLPCDVGKEEGFQTLTKAGLDILWNTREKQETDSQVRKEIIIQKGLNIHLLSPGISSNTITYLKWRKESRPTLHLLLFFGPSSFSAERDPSCSLSQREGQMTKCEGGKRNSGKATETRRKRDWVWQLEGMGRKGESLRISEQKWWWPLQKQTWEPQAPTIFCIKQLKSQQQRVCLISLQHSFTKAVKQLL